MSRKQTARRSNSDNGTEPVPEIAHATAEILGRILAGAEVSSRRALRSLSEFVQERPLTSVAAAFGVGILVTRLLRRSRF